MDWSNSLKLKRLNDWFLNMQLFTSQDINWWTGVVWITCRLLWCFIRWLDSHSDGTHWWASVVMLNFSKYFLIKKHIYVMDGWMAWRGYILRKLSFLGRQTRKYLVYTFGNQHQMHPHNEMMRPTAQCLSDMIPHNWHEAPKRVRKGHHY